MDEFATSDVLSVGESGHLCVLCLHRLDLTETRLAVLDAGAQLRKVHLCVRLAKTFLLQTILLTVHNLAHVLVLVQGPIS